MIARGNVANVYNRRTSAKRMDLACGPAAIREDNPYMASAMAETEIIFLGVKDAEQIILCSRFHIHALFEKGILKGHRIGRKRRIRVDSIREHLAGDEYRLGLLDAKLAQIESQKKTP